MRIAADNENLHVALGLMRERGGAFARSIEEAYARADRENKARLRLAFGDLMCKYGADVWEGSFSGYSGKLETYDARPIEPVLARMLA